MRNFVLGDIHGAYKALTQCFERSGFDRNHDRLIFLGDVCDRGPESVECIDLLLEVKHLVAVMGNHDFMTMKWLEGSDEFEHIWFDNGGLATMESYTRHHDFEALRDHHLEAFYRKLLPYYKDAQNRVYLHAGFDPELPIEESTPREYYWDRNLFRKAIEAHPNGAFPTGQPYKEIYIGHSPTFRVESDLDTSIPVKFCNVWCLDQGAGWGKKLSLMEIDTREVFQSDNVDALYT